MHVWASMHVRDHICIMHVLRTRAAGWWLANAPGHDWGGHELDGECSRGARVLGEHFRASYMQTLHVHQTSHSHLFVSPA